MAHSRVHRHSIKTGHLDNLSDRRVRLTTHSDRPERVSDPELAVSALREGRRAGAHRQPAARPRQRCDDLTLTLNAYAYAYFLGASDRDTTDVKGWTDRTAERVNVACLIRRLSRARPAGVERCRIVPSSWNFADELDDATRANMTEHQSNRYFSDTDRGLDKRTDLESSPTVCAFHAVLTILNQMYQGCTNGPAAICRCTTPQSASR